MPAAARYTTPARYLDHLESAVGMAVAARSSAVAGICLGLAGLAPRHALPALLRRRARWDLDSVAAIYCALAGAFAPDTIPALWVARIEDHSGTSFESIGRSLFAIRRQRLHRMNIAPAHADEGQRHDRNNK